MDKLLSKEEIRHSHDIFITDGDLLFDEHNIHTAMDEYAKQTAIAFLLDTTGDMFKHNAEELYKKFESQK